MLPFLLLLLLLPSSLAAAADLRLFHRIFHPSLPQSLFYERATLSLAPDGHSASLVPSSTLLTDLDEFAHIAQGLQDGGALYQVALERDGDPDAGSWAISAVKACHLFQSTSDSIILHLAQDGKPFSLDYFVGPIPPDGSCPKKIRKKTSAVGADSSSTSSVASAFAHVTNSTVSVARPRFPPLPSLRVPPPVTVEGKPVEPPVEKSFIQKYWLYLVVALFALVLAPGQAEEEAGAGRGAAR